ncbi:unnamed protein product [Caenorhabditis angaria]|uniref:Uncharacterized protein n=1 Tax=Caenorhabditis angaria TaxID=860376 RepID=A0A9P1MWE1_9PELO|nr:unnamed protein product [Caenorhabditis angaria]
MINTQVLLFDYDNPGSSDLLDSTFTDQNGSYTISGSEREFGGIEAFMCIKHNCLVWRPGQIECWRFEKKDLDKVIKLNEDLGKGKKIKTYYAEFAEIARPYFK